jgi:hypothetical protein
VLALPLLCGWWGWRTTSHALAGSASESLSPKDRIEVFERVWKAVNDKYYDSSFNGVDWNAAHERYRPLVGGVKTDQEFYALLNQMLSELHDAHTHFRTPGAGGMKSAQRPYLDRRCWGRSSYASKGLRTARPPRFRTCV